MNRVPTAVVLGTVLAACILSVSVLAAEKTVSSRIESRDGREFPVIGNPFLELTFDPARGGRCVSFRFKDNGEQLVGTRDTSGMFLDHWAKYTWPSGLMHLPYHYEIVEDGKTRVGIRLWLKVPEKGGGRGSPNKAASVKIPTSPHLIGLVVKKTIWVRAESDLIEVDQEVENATSQSRGVAIYVQHALSMNGNRYNDMWYLPSTEGIKFNMQPEQEGGKTIGTDWVLKPTAGWIAVRDRKTDRGMLFAFDYNYVQKIYTCGSTAEWFMEAVPVAGGKSFTTSYVIKPVRGFKAFVRGSERIVADIRPTEVGKEIRVYHDIAAVSKALADLQVEFTVVNWRTKEQIAHRTMKLAKLGPDMTRQEFSFPKPEKLTDGVVIKAEVKSPDFEEHYERYYAGDKADYERIHNPFATKGMAIGGTRGGGYYLKPPRKKKIFPKPDFGKVPRPAKDRFKCLVVFGLYTHILNIDDALGGWIHKGGNSPVEFTWANCPPNAIETFPGSYDELFSYNIVVLSDVNYHAVGDIGFEMICDYVEQGGGLLVVGGPYALGNGEFEETRFLDVLPIELSGPFDLKWAGEGKSWAIEPATPDHPVLKDVSFAQEPRVFWHHFVKPKAGAQTVLQAGDKSVLILGRYGKGKVAVLTLSPTGIADKGETAWWNWDGWSPLVKNVFRWLNESAPGSPVPTEPAAQRAFSP